jgi:hypothetical protein
VAESPNDMMLARESGSVEIDGTEYQLHRGVTRVKRSHPLHAVNPGWWELDESAVTYEVEDATKEPGKKRGQKA